jgi:hypothetical protein
MKKHLLWLGNEKFSTLEIQRPQFVTLQKEHI